MWTWWEKKKTVPDSCHSELGYVSSSWNKQLHRTSTPDKVTLWLMDQDNKQDHSIIISEHQVKSIIFFPNQQHKPNTSLPGLARRTATSFPITVSSHSILTSFKRHSLKLWNTTKSFLFLEGIQFRAKNCFFKHSPSNLMLYVFLTPFYWDAPWFLMV